MTTRTSMQMKNNHGGKREGAGRKAKPSREVLYARVAEGTVAKLREMAEVQGCTVGDIIDWFNEHGFNASIEDGRITITGDEDTYIISSSSSMFSLVFIQSGK